MLNNYNYFITLAEEKNISRAAERLFISHQCLSKYLKNLEQEYRVTFFERSPRLKLTVAGEAMLNMLRQVQFLERNLESQLDDIRQSRRGIIRLGTTEGRYRILFPEMLAQYKRLYPEVRLDVHYANSEELATGILRNDFDIVIMNKTFVNLSEFEIHPLLDEKLYLVISDNMLAQYFSGQYPECKCRFQKEGVNLAEFQDVPFVLNRKTFNSRISLDAYLKAHDLCLKCVMELTQLDVHFQLSAQDYAASFCWTMYIPTILQMNKLHPEHYLNIYSICDAEITNQFVCAFQKRKLLPRYGWDLIQLIKNTCNRYYNPVLG